MEVQNKLLPDFAQARRFLAALDPTATQWTFQTFDDNKSRRDERKRAWIESGGPERLKAARAGKLPWVEVGKQDPLAFTRHGTFDECAPFLAELQNQGAGVFVTVNRTTLVGRRIAENVTEPRALYIDVDGAEPQGFKVRPSIVVDNARGPHVYWKLRDGERLDKFRDAQEALIHHLGSDEKIKYPHAVLRLPGFWHLKGEPVQVRIREINPGVEYTVDELLAAYPQPPKPEPVKYRTVLPISDPDFEAFQKWALERPTGSKGEIDSNGRANKKGRNGTVWEIITEGFAEGFNAEQVLAVALKYGELAGYPDETEAERLVERARLDHELVPFEVYRVMEPFADKWGQFELTDAGLYITNEPEPTKKNPNPTPTRFRVCSPLKVIAQSRDEQGGNWGRVIRFIDNDRQVKDVILPMEMFAAEKGEEWKRLLLNQGVVVDHGVFVSQYITKKQTTERVRCVSRLGWFRDNYVLPDKTFGPGIDGEGVVLQSSTNSALRTSGTLTEWQREIGARCIGNSRLLFAVSAAFAGPLLELTGGESGGFHLRGSSSTGKSTTLWVAGSVWGGGETNGFIKTWRATSNGLEGIAAAHNDGLLLLDEIGEVDGREVGATVYMLANGTGKQRMKSNATLREASKWKLLFLSTGEKSLEEHAKEVGKQTKAGQEIRNLDIPSDAGKGLGLFDTLHGAVDASEFARALKDASLRLYGTPIRAFLEKMVSNNPAYIKEVVKRYRTQFLTLNLGAQAEGQVSRACQRFALVAAAGELAIEFGVLPWPAGEALKGVGRCFEDWLKTRESGAANAEIDKALTQIQTKLFRNYSKFQTPFKTPEPNAEGKIEAPTRTYAPQDCWGWRDNDFIFVQTEVFRDELCRGFDSKAVAAYLKDKKMLIPGTDRDSVVTHPPGEPSKRVRMIKLLIQIFEAENKSAPGTLSKKLVPLVPLVPTNGFN